MSTQLSTEVDFNEIEGCLNARIASYSKMFPEQICPFKLLRFYSLLEYHLIYS